MPSLAPISEERVEAMGEIIHLPDTLKGAPNGKRWMPVELPVNVVHLFPKRESTPIPAVAHLILAVIEAAEDRRSRRKFGDKVMDALVPSRNPSKGDAEVTANRLAAFNLLFAGKTGRW